MVSANTPSQSTIDNLSWPQVDRRVHSEPSTEGQYRVVALPVGYALTDDVIIKDAFGNPFLLTHGSPRPTPLELTEVNSLGMFFEPAQDSSWHTLPELRRIIFGISETLA